MFGKYCRITKFLLQTVLVVEWVGLMSLLLIESTISTDETSPIGLELMKYNSV